MAYEEGFSSADEVVEKQSLFGRFGRKKQVVPKPVGRPEGADAFLASERIKVVVLQEILQQLKDLNEVVTYVGAAVDGLQPALAKKKENNNTEDVNKLIEQAHEAGYSKAKMIYDKKVRGVE